MTFSNESDPRVSAVNKIEGEVVCRDWSPFSYFFAVALPLIGVAISAWLWLIGLPVDRFFLALACAAFIIGSSCTGLWQVFNARVASHKVVSPEMREASDSVWIIADAKPDPMLAPIVLRIFWGSSAFAFLFLAISGPGEVGDNVLFIIFGTAFVVIGVFSFGWAGYYVLARGRRRRYPGHIEMNAWGLRQRVGDRVVEVAWKDIAAFKSVDRNERGEIIGSWIADSEKKVSCRASRRPKLYRQRRAQPLFLLLTPVGDVMNFVNFLRDAQNNPAWAAEIFNSPHRLEWIHSILTAHEPGLEILGGPAAVSDGYGAHLHLLSDPRYPGPGRPFSVSAGGM